MKTRLFHTFAISAIAAISLTGCVGRRVVQVPVYQNPSASAGQPAYAYPPQTAYQNPTPPPAVQQVAPVPSAPPANEAAVAPQALLAQPATPAPAVPVVVAPQAPPAAQVEVVPIAPGPEYVWAPGYWSWNGAWIWVAGRWVIRPHPRAVWVGGHWGRHGRGYVWIGGHWR